MPLDYEKIYEDNLDFICDTFYHQMKVDKAYGQYLEQTGQQSSQTSLRSYFDHEAESRLKELKNIPGNESNGTSKKDTWKIISYFRKEDIYMTDKKTFQKFKTISTEEKAQMETFIANPANQKALENIFKINFSADFCTNMYHRSRINQRFDAIKGFEKSEFIPSLDKGNCTKGLTLSLCEVLEKHGALTGDFLRDKETWAHPAGVFEMVNRKLGRNTAPPENMPLGDCLAQNEFGKGTIFIINNHHAMLYTGEKNEQGEPLFHGYSPEATDYPLKLDKPVYAIDIPALVQKQCGENAAQVIDEYVSGVKDDIQSIDLLQIFKQRLAQLQAIPAKKKFDAKQHLAYCQTMITARQRPIEITQQNKGRLTYAPQQNIAFQSTLKDKNQNS